jgi:hypothetical protein
MLRYSRIPMEVGKKSNHNFDSVADGPISDLGQATCSRLHSARARGEVQFAAVKVVPLRCSAARSAGVPMPVTRLGDRLLDEPATSGAVFDRAMQRR